MKTVIDLHTLITNDWLLELFKMMIKLDAQSDCFVFKFASYKSLIVGSPIDTMIAFVIVHVAVAGYKTIHLKK